MKTILVLKKSRTVKQKQKVERELYCYDHEKQKMLKFVGGGLGFENKYDQELDKYRLLPVVKDEYEIKDTRVEDNESVKNWFEIYANYNDTKAEKVSEGAEGITFSVEDDEVENFVYDLERQNMPFRIM